MLLDPYASVARMRQIIYARAGALPASVFPMHGAPSADLRVAGRWLLTDLLASGTVTELGLAGADDLADLLVWPRTIWGRPGECVFDIDLLTPLSLFGLLVYRMQRASGFGHAEALENIRADYGAHV